MSSDLETYLIQKGKKKFFETATGVNPLEIKTPITPTKPLHATEDYSPGSDYWRRAITSKSDNSDKSDVLKSTSPRKEKMVDFRPLKSTNSSSSVANLLKRMKGNEVPRADVSEGEVTIMSMEEKVGSISLENSPSTLMIEAIHGLEQKLEAQKSILLDLLKSDKLNNESSLTLDQLESALDKKMEQLETLRSKDSNQLKTTLPSSKGAETLQRDILQQLSVIQTEIQGSKNPIDRPTKAIISAMNDKLIHMSKLQEHEFSNQIQKLSLIEKKIARPNNSAGDQTEVLQDIRKMVISIDSHIGRVERQNQADNSKIEKLLKLTSGNKSNQFHSESSDGDSSDKDDVIQRQLADLKKIITKDQKLTEERMSQFMNMFTILQTAHLELLNRLEKLDNSAKIDALASKLEKITVSSLPPNVESKLLFIERELRNLKK